MEVNDSPKGQMVYGRNGTIEGKVTPIDDGETHSTLLEGKKYEEVKEEDEIAD